jgi:flagellar motor switch protein FliN/FliY
MEDPDLKKSAQDAKGKKPSELRTVKFQSFDEDRPAIADKAMQQNIDLIIDVPLQVTVVLGKSKKSIKEILELGLGSVIVLDRLAGEMVDVLVLRK